MYNSMNTVYGTYVSKATAEHRCPVCERKFVQDGEGMPYVVYQVPCIYTCSYMHICMHVSVRVDMWW